jgi:hypothetical protein
MHRTLSLAVLLAGTVLGGALAQEPAPAGGVQLEYQFDKLAGKTAVYRIKTESRVEQSIEGVAGEGAESGGGEVATSAQETQEHSFDRAAEGGGSVTIVTRRVKARLEQADGTAEYDSLGDGPVPQALESLADRVGKPVTLEVTRHGKVESVKGVRVSQRKAYKTSFLELPEQPLRFGGSWDRLDRQPMPPLGTLVYHFQYTLAGLETDEETGQERIRIDAVVTAELEDAPRGRQMSVELVAQEGRGYLLIDRQGLVHESLLESSIELLVKAPAGRQIQRLRTKSEQILLEVVDGE